MSKIKVSEAEGHALNYLVATCKGATNFQRISTKWCVMTMPADDAGGTCEIELSELAYSTDWALGGLIIECEEIELYRPLDLNDTWQAAVACEPEAIAEFGPTPLIAAMRAYVANKLGDEVEAPDGLN